MATMIPSTIHSSVCSGAERRMFNIIKTAERTENWICLHSLGLARHSTKRLGEIDFVMITTHGIFVLEVKGGRIRRQGGSWIFKDRLGREHVKAEGPFEQAASAMFTLEREIRQEFRGSRISDVLFGFGVVVPDITFDVIGPDFDQKQVYDRTDRPKAFRTYIDRLAEFSRKRDPRRRRGLRDADIEKIAGYLRSDFDLIPSVKTLLDDTGYQLLRLTEEQFAVLDVLRDDPRVVIEGPAGSGKTVLAVEAVRRSARRGDRVLLTCYNRLLAEELKKTVADEFDTEKVTVASLHQLFSRLISKSSLNEEFDERRAELPEREVFDVLMPELALYAAMEEVIQPFDILVIDEAQDVLTTDTLEVLSELVVGGADRGQWWFFLDSNNQASVYGKLDKPLFESVRKNARSQLLTVNCRNTKEIAYHTSLISRPKVATNGRVDGPPVEFISVSDKGSPLERVTTILRNLENQDVPGERVTVLFARTPSEQDQATLQEVGVSPVKSAETSKSPTWVVVSGFKGLENDVILLVGVEDIDGDWWRSICYVGMSRARSRLYVVLSTECEEIRKKKWATELKQAYEEQSQ